MPSPADLGPDALKVALEATDTLLTFGAYTPVGSKLVMLLGSWRDDLSDALDSPPAPRQHRGSESRSLNDLDMIRLGSLDGALMILLQPRFTRVMDDPELPSLMGEFASAVRALRAERLRPRQGVRI